MAHQFKERFWQWWEDGGELGAGVVHVTTVHNPSDPRIFHKQLSSLQRAGFDTHLIAPNSGPASREGIQIHPLPEGRRSWLERLLLQPRVYRQARVLDADLYQIHDPELIPVAYLLKKRTGARIVYDMHENYRTKGAIWGRALRWLERWCFGWADHVLLAEQSYRSIVSAHSVPSTCILNYFRPIGDESSSREDSTSQGVPTRLLYTGTVSRERGLDTMLDLASLLRSNGRDERVDIVGVCNWAGERREATRRIREDGLHSVVEWVGGSRYVPPEEMTPYYHRADVGLALCEPKPNLQQSILTKFYEYLHHGLPIVCSDFPLWRRFVEENSCGVVVPPGDAQAVLDVIDRWREEPERYRQYAENARAAADHYRWAEMEERLLRVYRTLLPTVEPGHVGGDSPVRKADQQAQ